MGTVKLPATVKDMKKRLATIEGLLMVKGWERAGTIYAFTEVREAAGQPTTSIARSSNSLTVSEFAALGIVGLESKDTVRKYHKQWAKVGDPNIRPGDTIEIPDIDYPPIESRPNRKRVSAMKADKLAEDIAARDDAEKVIAKIAEKNLDAAVTGTGKALRKKNVRAKKEQEADTQTDQKPGQKKAHTDRGSAESLIRLHAAKSELDWFRTYLDDNPDLVLTKEEQVLILDALTDIETDAIAVRMIVSNVLEQLEA